MEKIFWAIRAIIYKIKFEKIGYLSYIGKPISILNAKKISIGKKVRIYPHARMEVHGNGSILIGNNVSIGQGLHLTAGSCLAIGENTTISSNVLITDIDHDYEEIDVHIMDQRLKIKNTIIGENCFIGSGAKILPGTKLGKQVIVGCNSVVKGEFPDYCVIAGIPAKIIKKYNLHTNQWEKVE